MSTTSKMSSLYNLNLDHMDDAEHPTTPVSNMPFDESIEFRTSDCVSSEIVDKISQLEESQRFGKEDFNVYKLNCLPPIPPIKEEEEEDLVDEIEERTYKGHYYADAMDMEEAMRCDARKLKNLGYGKMYYIEDNHYKLMMTNNEWQAITQTNTWDLGFCSSRYRKLYVVKSSDNK